MHYWGYVMEQLTHGDGHAASGQGQLNSIEVRRNRRRWMSLVGPSRGSVPPDASVD